MIIILPHFTLRYKINLVNLKLKHTINNILLLLTDKSGKPGNVKVADHDNQSADIVWDPPKDDGGAPIQKYIVQKKPKGGEWENAAEVRIILLISANFLSLRNFPTNFC